MLIIVIAIVILAFAVCSRGRDGSEPLTLACDPLESAEATRTRLLIGGVGAGAAAREVSGPDPLPLAWKAGAPR